MPYKLYNRLGSGGFAVEAALALAGVEFEFVEVDSIPGTPLPEAFREINPWRQVPVFFTEDGTMMTESAAILIYLATMHPGDDVGPELGTPEHAKLLRWLVFLSANVYEAILQRLYSDRFTTDQNGVDAVAEAAYARVERAFDLLERELTPGSYLLGSRMSVGDVYLAMMYSWSAKHCNNPLCEALTHRVAAHDVVAPIWQRNFDHRLPIKWGRP